MATYRKIHLSESDGGQPIKISATGTPGTSIHFTDDSLSNLDEVWLYANNTSGSAVTLTIEYGGKSSPDNLVAYSIPANTSMIKVIPGLLLSVNSGENPLEVSAFASTTNVVTVVGFVNKIEG
jgi:hypothetical protein